MDYCQHGVIPSSQDVAFLRAPWDKHNDRLMDYLLELMRDEHYHAQVTSSALRGKMFYSQVGHFITDCANHQKFQQQRAWTEYHRIEKMLGMSELERMDTPRFHALLDELDEKHGEDGFDKAFFEELYHTSNPLDEALWQRLAHDWQECIDRHVDRKLSEYIAIRKANFETALHRVMDQVSHYMKRNHVTEAQAAQAWDLMDGMWTETEFERQLRTVKIQERYPAIGEIVARMGRVADAKGKDRLTVSSGVSMKMEHSSGSDIEGVTIGDDLNSLLPSELAQYTDDDMEDIFIYKYRTRRLQTFRYKSEMSKPSRKLGFTHASRRGPMIVCIDTSASMYGVPQRITSSLLSLVEETAERLNRDCFLIDFSVSVRAIDLMQRRKEKRMMKVGFKEEPTNFERGKMPFIGGGTSAVRMMEVMFELLDDDKRHYVNADVLWVTDFMIPMPPSHYISKLHEYRETGTKFYGLKILSREDEESHDWEQFFDHIDTITYHRVRRY